MKTTVKNSLVIVAVTLMLSSFAHNALAQEGHEWGVMAGVNTTTSSNENIGWGTGGQIGVYYEHALNKDWLSLQPRLQLSFTETRGKGNTAMANALYNQWAVSLPVLLSTKMQLSKDWNIKWNLGPYVQYAAFGQYRIPLSPNQNRAFWHSRFGDKLTWGLQGGIQFEYKQWFTSIDTKYSFRKNNNHQVSAPGKEQCIMFSVGHKF